MSLKIWLPLNGDLKNQGLSDLKFSLVNYSNAVVPSTSGGKVVSGTYKRTSRDTADYIISDNNIILDGDVTMCCWAKVTGIGDSGTANGLFGQHGHLTGGLGITMKDVSSTDLRMSVNTGLYGDNHDSYNDRTYCTYYGSTNIYNAWHHLCLTYSSSTRQLRMYVDGKLENIVGYGSYITLQGNNTTSRPVILFAWSTDHLGSDIPHYRPPCELNDVRIYDECLGVKEIKEIAKGLAAHYQMKIPKAKNYVEGKGLYIYDNWGVASSIVATGETYRGYPVYRLTQTPTEASLSDFRTELYSHGVYQSADMGFSLTETSKWSYWIYARPVSHPHTTRIGGTASNTGNWVESLPEYQGDGWYRVGQTRTVTADRNDAIYTSYYTSDAQAGVPIVVDFCGPHLLKGTNHVFDNYDKYISNNGIIEDVSGYGNDLTIAGTLIPYKNSPRYENCVSYNQTGYLRKTNFKMETNQFTIAFWLYPPYTINAQHFIFGTFDNWTGNGVGMWRDSTGGGYSAIYRSNGESSYTGLPELNVNHDTWQHIACVYTGTQGIIYKNGAEVGRVNGGSGGTISHPVLYLGNSKYNGEPTSEIDQASMSDFRFYATALSAADIKELYNTPTTLTKTGTLMAKELIEKNVETAKINKNGIVNASNFSSKNALLDNMKVKILEDGTEWARIHHHDIRQAQNYFSVAEVANCDMSGKYSKMDNVTSFKAPDENYEFMLTYPTIKRYVPSGYTLLESIESTGIQRINTGVYGNARWEFDIKFVNETGGRQLMGYNENGTNYWGINDSGYYEAYNTINYRGGKRDTVVYSYGEDSDYTLWVNNQSLPLTQGNVSGSYFTLFAITDYDTLTCQAKLYRCKCVQSGSLVRDFIPVLRNADGEIGLYDLVNNKFYGNNGSGKFIGHSLNKYIPVEYVESNGTQYVDINLPLSDSAVTNLKFEMDVQFLNTAETNKLYGHGNTYAGFYSNSNILYWALGGVAATDSSIVADTNRHKWTVDGPGKTVSFDGITKSITPGSNPISQFCLFGWQPSNLNSSRCYGFKVWVYGKLERDLIPVISTTNNEAGLYDLVNGRFYKSSNSNKLVAGGMVIQSDNNYEFLEYLQSSGTQIINTGYTPSGNSFTVDMKFRYFTDHAGLSLFGNNVRTPYCLTIYGNKPGFYAGDSSYVSCGPDTVLNQDYTLRATVGGGAITAYWNNVKYTASYSGSLYTGAQMRVFGSVDPNTNGNAEMGNGYRLYWFQITDNNSTVRSMYPVRRKSDGVLGMYDSITGGFYTNSGSGSFIAGPVVLAPVEIPLYNRWIQNDWTNDVNVGDSISIKRIFTSWPEHFGPIKPTNSTADTVYDCDNYNTGNWYAPVGQLRVWEGGIPAANGTMQKETELWVRFDRKADVNTASIQKYGSMSAKKFKEI